MTTSALLTMLRSRGMVLIPNQGRLRIEAPRGSVTDADWALLVRHKPALLFLLTAEARFRPLPWRQLLPEWPDAWRECWGRRAVALEDQGLDWRSAEQRAFVEVHAAMAQAAAAEDAYAHAEREAIRDEDPWD